MSDPDELVKIKCMTSPEWSDRVNKIKYIAKRDVFLPALPTKARNMTVAEAKAELLPNLSDQVFPSGEKAGWWLTAVQFYLDAQGYRRTC